MPDPRRDKGSSGRSRRSLWGKNSRHLVLSSTATSRPLSLSMTTRRSSVGRSNRTCSALTGP